MKREELAWAAGLFEGEGCFTGGASAKINGTSFQPRARLNMTDQDTVLRFQAIIGFGTVRPKKSPTKPQWLWQIASFVEVQALVALLWSWLGERRRARAKQILLAAQRTKRPIGPRSRWKKGKSK